MGKKIIYPVIAVTAVLFSIIYSFISGTVTARSHQAAGMADPETAAPESFQKTLDISAPVAPNKEVPVVSAPIKKSAAPQATRTTKSS